MIRKFCHLCLVLVGSLLGLVVLIVCSLPLLARLGFFRWYAENVSHFFIGFAPAFHYGVEWGFTMEEEIFQSSSSSDLPLLGQRAIVTGANSGIGYEIALALARFGANVTLACRNPIKCQQAAERMRADETVRGSIFTKTLDTSSLTSVQTFAKEYIRDNPSLDILMLNAGTSFPNRSTIRNDGVVPLSEDGIEIVFATNYVGHHLLYRSLEPLLQRSKMARVVQTSSAASFLATDVATDLKTLNTCDPRNNKFNPKVAYRQSKLAQILWTKALTRRLSEDSNIYVNTFHPGLVDTNIWDKQLIGSDSPTSVVMLVNWLRRHHVMWTSSEGALTGVFLAVAQDRLRQDNIRGRYYHPQTQRVTIPMADDVALQDRLWTFTEELVENFLPQQELSS